MINLIQNMFTYLANNPLIGMIAGFYSTIIANTSVLPTDLATNAGIVSYLGMIVGIIIGALTIFGLVIKHVITLYNFKKQIDKDKKADYDRFGA